MRIDCQYASTRLRCSYYLLNITTVDAHNIMDHDTLSFLKLLDRMINLLSAKPHI